MKRRQLKPLALVQILWVDSVSFANWLYDEEIQGFEPPPIATVGYVVENTKDSLAVASTIGLEAPSALGVLAIPWGCIRKVSILED